MKKKILAAMSGGVDSSAAAAILVEKGWDVTGVSMKLSSCQGQCCGDDGIEDARRTADSLGIPFYALDCSGDFEKEVVDYFKAEYSRGRTPNPCAVCNKKIKFGLLLKKAASLGMEKIATGHYAGVDFDEKTGRFILRNARDASRDQTYFLFQLSQEQLSKIMFPLEKMAKTAVRAYAKKLGLKVHDRKESREICFVTDDYRNFLKDSDIKLHPGRMTDRSGKTVGRHDGVALYTIGQRKGLGAHGRPVYVTSLDAEKNEVVIGTEKELYKKRLIVSNINWMDRDEFDSPEKFRVKIRYGHKAAPARVSPAGDGSVEVEFVTAQRAPSPGQAAVFYRGRTLSGGGWIESVR